MDKRKQIFEFKKLSVKNYKIVNPDNRINNDSNIEPLGEGGSGIVFKAIQILHDGIVIERAIKFFMYRDNIAYLTRHRYDGPVSSEDFLSEIRNISSFSHEGLISVVDAGIYSIDEYDIPFIVTDYVNGPTLRHVINPDSDKENPRHRDEAKSIQKRIRENPIFVLDLLIKTSKAIEHLHNANFFHCDIAPKNIFIRNNEILQPVLGDLGIAKDFNYKRKKVFIAGSKRYIPNEVLKHLNEEVQWEEFKRLQPKWDLFSFAKTGLELIELVSNSDQSWIKPLQSTFNNIISGNTKLNSMSQVVERLEFLQPFHRELAGVPELSPGLTGKRRNLMPVESLSISERVGKIIHHPALLRLGNVPQLTMANQLFPGANHTRYEHSLGVMETIRRYLSALLDQDLFLEHLSIEKIETALISALLCNITRFPLSNIFHEIKSKNKEELGIFSRDNLLSDIEKIHNKKKQSLVDIISEYFPSVRYDCVKNILLGKKDRFDNEDRLIYSFLNSSLDARVVDFVRRDSLHLGIIKGDIFDLDELLPHLTIHKHKLALKLTGVSVAEQIISLRYWLFQRIYWNSPNRKFCAMVRHIILELSEKTNFTGDFRRVVLEYNHNRVLKYLLEYSKENNIKASTDIAQRLARNDQDLYRTVLDLGQHDRSDFVSICKKIAGMNYKQISLLEEELEKYVISDAGFNIDRNNDKKLFLIDVPFEPGDSKLGDDIIVIKPDNNAVNLKEFSGIIGGINNSFETHLRRLRVFMNPDSYPRKHSDRVRLEEIVRTYLGDHVA